MDTGISDISSTGCKPKSWKLNYPALLNGRYYADYASIMSTMGGYITLFLGLVTMVMCDQARTGTEKYGHKAQWTANCFDAFYLTRGYHSNTTLHDVESDSIAWFTHCTKHGKGYHWEGTSSGTQGDMLDELLDKVKLQG